MIKKGEVMQKILEDYKRIYEVFPEKVALNKKQKKERHQMLMKWKDTTYEENVEFMCGVDFLREHEELPHSMPFLQKMLLPVLAGEIKQKYYENLKIFFELLDEDFFDINHDALFLLSQELEYQLNGFQLCNLVLEKYPNHLPTVQYKYNLLDRILDFSVHEVPSGILMGMDGADLDGLDALMTDLREFERLSGILGRQERDKEYIEYCAKMYREYAHYLRNMEKYENFADCLEQHKENE